MILKKKPRVKILFKQLIKLRENVQDKTKLLKFKRKKWDTFLEYYLKKYKKYRKFKPQDQTRYTISRYPYKGTSHKKQYRNNLNCNKKFRLLYGNLSEKELKKYVKFFLSKKLKQTTHKNLLFLKLFERRLDTVIFRSKFSKSFRDARQLISHETILVNNKIIKSPDYKLKTGDLISINSNKQNLIEENLKYCIRSWIEHNIKLWPLPPKHLIINYNTMEIFIENINLINFSTDFTFNLNLEKILINYRKS